MAQVPVIKINATVRPEIADLINSVHKFYPSDFQNQNTEKYSNPILDKIVEEKANQIIEGRLPEACYSLMTATQELFKDKTIIKGLERQFPSYGMTIMLNDQTSNNICSQTSITLKISLLTNYYTVFFEEFNWFLNFPKYKATNRPILFRIFSSANPSIDQKNLYFSSLQKIIEEHFPTHKFIEHRLLLNKKIEYGFPYQLITHEKSFPLFAYLFDNDVFLSGSNYEVVE
jgi:hypothetical protein